MQTICTSLQTDNYTNTPPLNFYRLDALPDAQPTSESYSAKIIRTLLETNWREPANCWMPVKALLSRSAPVAVPDCEKSAEAD